MIIGGRATGCDYGPQFGSLPGTPRLSWSVPSKPGMAFIDQINPSRWKAIRVPSGEYVGLAAVPDNKGGVRGRRGGINTPNPLNSRVVWHGGDRHPTGFTEGQPHDAVARRRELPLDAPIHSCPQEVGQAVEGYAGGVGRPRWVECRMGLVVDAVALSEQGEALT